jgi:murein DD-endopeptidase MepM/ murein hydrolase activator NlpD
MQGQVQNELNLALASAARVQAEVDRLNAAVSAQQKALGSAQSAEAAADADATSATRWLTDANRRLDQARGELRAWALRAYVRSDNFFPASGADINELARGQALLSVAIGSQNDAIDVYRQDQRDQLQASAGVRATLATAQARTRAATDEATTLLEAKTAQQAAQAALQTRITDLQGESAVLATQEKSIEALIAVEGAAAKVALAYLGVTRQGSAAGLIWPVHGPVTSEFGPRWGGFHPGIDIAAPFGTAIQAARDGVVIFAGWNGGYGNFVLIDHGGGEVTGYAHQSRIAVTRGQIVHAGDVIGYEGSTGYSTGPHVHFEVRINGAPQNPRNYEAGSP